MRTLGILTIIWAIFSFSCEKEKCNETQASAFQFGFRATVEVRENGTAVNGANVTLDIRKVYCKGTTGGDYQFEGTTFGGQYSTPGAVTIGMDNTEDYVYVFYTAEHNGVKKDFTTTYKYSVFENLQYSNDDFEDFYVFNF